MSRRQPKFEITSDILLRAYSIGLFPMAEDRDAAHLSRSLAKSVRSDVFDVRANGAFEVMMKACANRDRTWINKDILRLYCELHERGHAHSIEAYQCGQLVGGLYGVSLGAAFFGESMFHVARDASKVALVHLVARLRLGGFRLLDSQFVTPHLASLGCVEISRAQYRARLAQAIDAPADFAAWAPQAPMRGEKALAFAQGRGSGDLQGVTA
jgi:leucyl/phenylalanyl-tRNA--protein transferase